jgi:ABC-type amino acid transport substrate-binding protein
MMLWQIVLAVLVTEVAQGATLYYTSDNIKPHVKRAEISKDSSEQAYLFAADGKQKPKSFINEYGALVGFDVDLVNAVCKVAGKTCYMVLAEFTECIFTDRDIDYSGRGLWADWFDGCTSYAITSDRLNEFDFTLPYLETTASFTVAPGNPTNFTPEVSDYSSFKLLRLTGAPTNKECLKRLHKKFDQVLVAQDLPEAKALLLNGTADVLFSPRNVIDGLEVLPERVHCDVSGAGIMLKKGSSVPSWWDPAFQKYYLSGEYSMLCAAASFKYGRIHCLPPPEKITPQLAALMAAPPKATPKKLWKFVVSGRIAPYSYVDDDGQLKGFTPDMLATVCGLAKESCVLLLAQVPECTVRKGEILYPGRGLMEGWFDGCTGYYETQDRDNSWDFTLPYLVSNASFFVPQGNPKGFDPSSTDYSSFTIVYQATAITNDHCLHRLYKRFNKLIVVENEQDAVALILNGTADTWFTKEIGISQLEQLPQRFHCEHVGTSIMLRKGSEMRDWWNKAFDKFTSSGDFKAFCENESRIHGNYTFPCYDAPGKRREEIIEGY